MEVFNKDQGKKLTGGRISGKQFKSSVLLGFFFGGVVIGGWKTSIL